jgi:hypothetical protein
MKVKNHYVWVCVLWIICTILHSINCAVNFVDGNLAKGFIYLICAVAFSFVSGLLLIKALQTKKHNDICDFLDKIAEEIIEKQIKNIKPFEEFENEKINK